MNHSDPQASTLSDSPEPQPAASLVPKRGVPEHGAPEHGAPEQRPTKASAEANQRISPTAVGLAVLCAVCIYGVCHFWKASVVSREQVNTLETELEQARRDSGRYQRLARLADPREISKLRDTHYDFVVDNYGFEYAGRTGDLIDEQILMYGLWEKGPAFFMRDILVACADDEPVFIDVGCNVGHHSLFLAQYASEVHGFDPYPPAVERFQGLIERNAMTNVTVHPVGLGAEEAELPFFGPHEGNFGSGTFNQKWAEGRDEMKLKIVRGDDWLKQQAIDKVALIKIDIEGYEESALAGLSETLKSQRPIVFMEVTPAPGGTLESYEQLLTLFPDNYECVTVLEYVPTTRIDGKYLTMPFGPSQAEAFFASDGQAMIAVYPAERKSRIPDRPYQAPEERRQESQDAR